MKLKKLLVIIALLILALMTVFSSVGFLFAQEPKGTPTVYLFYGEGCPHCAKEEQFLGSLQLQSRFPVNIKKFEVWHNVDNAELLTRVAGKLGATVRGVPFTVVGKHFTEGYLSDETTGAQIARWAEGYWNEQEIYADMVWSAQKDLLPQTIVASPVASVGSVPIEIPNISNTFSIPTSVDVPFLGNISTKDFSLPLLTLVLAGVDGFNPCAMWVLIFLIGLLLEIQNRRKMWILGGAFIAVSALVYFFFMAAWLNLLLFVGFIFWIRFAIGVFALGGGGYSIWKFFKTKEGVCEVTAAPARQSFFERLKNVVQSRGFLLALGGIIVLAAAVNVVELICSAGLPAIYTQVLALNNLSVWHYFLYLALYVFIFMLDDVIVFIIAMTTLRLTGFTGKYARWSYILGGIVMVIIGVLLLLKPELLMFG